MIEGNGQVLATRDQGSAFPLILIRAGGLASLPVEKPYGQALSGEDHLFFSTLVPGQQLFESDGTVAVTRELVDRR